MNLLGQWNKAKTHCWTVAMSMGNPPKYRAECWLASGRWIPYGPWRDTMEEAQRDIPNENT